jgi:hypothetical protein
MIATNHTHELTRESAAVERWENEGGKLRQHHGWNVTSVNDDRRDNKHLSFRGSLGRSNETTDAMIGAPNKATYVRRPTLFGQAYPTSVSAV